MKLPTGSVAFLFTDIEGSTRRWEEQPNAMRESLANHDRILRAAIEAHNGVVFKTVGDAFQAAFANNPDAVAAALDAQLELGKATWGETGPLRVRMGIHVGAAEAQGDDYATTPTLNRVARLMAAGYGGQILLSQSFVDAVRGNLPARAGLRDLGRHRLKDLSRAEQIFQLTYPELRPDFPALHSLDAFPNNLPVQLNSFVGRTREIARVKDLLHTPSTRLVTLTGMGGSGKTRLAIQVAGELVEHFFEGVWLIELEALTDPAFIVPRIATVLGVREDRGQELIDAVCEYCKSLHVLIVLDNCEHLIDGAVRVVERLLETSQELKILATSQEVLRVPGEVTCAVPTLSLPGPKTPRDNEHLQAYEAIHLFAERANSSDPNFNLNEHNGSLVVQVCQRLDGIPLALELAAARLRVLTLDQIASRLDDRFSLLASGSRTAMPRHQTLRATVDWSYDLCSESERVVWRRISIFANGFTLDAAEAIVGDGSVPQSQVLDLLGALVDRSLVVTDVSKDVARYRLLSSIQEYGRIRLGESGETQALRDKHRNYFVAFAERAEPELRRGEQAQWLDRLEAELDNLRAAMDWSLESDQGETALRICGALANFWLSRSHISEGLMSIAKALAVSAGQTAMRAKALNAEGNLTYTRGDYAHALESYHKGLDIYRGLNETAGTAKILNNLGNIVSLQGDFSRAREYYEEALMLQRQVGRTPLLSVLLGNLGNVFTQLGDYEHAHDLLTEALGLLRENNDKWGMAFIQQNLGEIAEARGDGNQARELYASSLALREQIDDRLGIAIVKSRLGHLAMHEKEFAKAALLLRASLVALNEIGDRQMSLTVLEYFAELWIYSAQSFSRAVQTLSAVSALRAAMGAPLLPGSRKEFDDALEKCRAGSSPAEFDEAWRIGSHWTFADAISGALAPG